MLNISFDKLDVYSNDVIFVLINDQLKFDQDIIDIDQSFAGMITASVEQSHKFKGKFLEKCVLNLRDSSGALKKVVLLGIGDETVIQAHQLEEIGGTAYNIANDGKSKTAGFLVSSSVGSHDADTVAASIASGFLLASYKFDKYFSKSEEEETINLEELNIVGKFGEQIDEIFAAKKAIAEGVFFARDLVSEAPNVLYPQSYAEKIIEEMGNLNVDVEVLGEREMQALGMGALLGVGQGSARESKMAILRYNGADVAEDKPICFVGKGVTFDTGGISLKPAAGMDAMKYDMGGSAAVVGAVKALAARKAKVNVVGIVGLVENMPGSNAQRPGDVVKTMSGKTVEVLNTDAEGRLVLCDCMTYLQKNFQPECVVDLATLTGAIIIALGHTYAGLFSNDDKLAESLTSSSFAVNEKLWRMPLHKDYDSMLKSSIADVANISTVAKGGAGSSTAAHFIQRFVEDGVKWAHLDIAGMAWDSSGANPICPRGAVGFGVRLLNQFVQDHYENR